MINLICKIVVGSKLYGTNTKDSDTDYKGVFMPTREQILLNKIPKSIKLSGNDKQKNTRDDIDYEIYSLQYFIKMACEGQTIVLDMLHAPKDKILIKNEIWNYLTKNRKKFYTKKLNALVGFAKTQADKYSTSSIKFDTCKKVLDYLETKKPESKIREFWGSLPTGEYINFLETDEKSNGLRTYEVCERKIQESVTITYAINMLKSFYKNYGKRVIEASDNNNSNWKSLYHAIRAAFQIKSIYLNNDIIFPLPEAKLLTQIKKGELTFKEVENLLSGLMAETKKMSKTVKLPEKIDTEFWNNWLMNTIEMEILNRYIG